MTAAAAANVSQREDHRKPPEPTMPDEHPESLGPEPSGTSIIIKSLIAILLGLFVWILPTPDNLNPEGHRLLALLTTVVILWVTEAIPIGVTALLVGGLPDSVQHPDSA